MSKLLIFIGEKQAFDIEKTLEAILSIKGINNAKRGSLVGAVFECEYMFEGNSTVVRISDDVETITVEGLGLEAADFAVKFQQRMEIPLNAIDMEYSFNLQLLNFRSGEELISAMSS